MIYFDNASTTPLSEGVKESIIEGMEVFGNPSSLHQSGRKTKAVVESARRTIAKDLGCLPAEIFFTSGATESLNMAIRASVATSSSKKIFCSELEHHAVLDLLKFLANSKQIDWIKIPNDINGVLDLSFLDEVAKDDIVVMMAHNNEIGNRNPIETISSAAADKEFAFICDTVQTIAYEAIDLKQLEGIQSLVISAHKFNGPKGAGVLFWRNPKPLRQLLYGGAQERALRPGTENILGIIGMTQAWQELQSTRESRRSTVMEHSKELRRKLSSIPDLEINGNYDHPGIINVSIPYPDRTSVLLFQLDLLGLCVSEGSACTSGSSQGSHVIKAMGKDIQGRANIRFSIGHLNSKEELEESMKILKKAITA